MQGCFRPRAAPEIVARQDAEHLKRMAFKVIKADEI
jgi:hypothetical protein